MNEHTFFEWKHSERLTAVLALVFCLLGLGLQRLPGVSFSRKLSWGLALVCLVLLGLSRLSHRHRGWKILLRTVQTCLALLAVGLAVLSGGQGPGEDISEARVMYDALTARGIDPERLILEEQSANTRQNLRNSLPLLEKQGFDSYGGRLAVITNGFHMARVGLLWDLPTELVQVPAKLPWWLDANYYLRESFAIVNDMVLRPLLA